MAIIIYHLIAHFIANDTTLIFYSMAQQKLGPLNVLIDGIMGNFIELLHDQDKVAQ